MVESKMPQVETQIVPSEEAAPLTREELAAKLEQLSARAKAAGLSPLQAMLSTYARRGMTMLDGLLAGLEEGNPKKPVEPPAPTEASPSKEGP